MGLAPDEKKCHSQTLKVEEIYIENRSILWVEWNGSPLKCILQMTTWKLLLGKPTGLSKSPLNLGGDVVRKKRKSQRKIYMRKKEWDREGERKQSYSFEKAHVDQWSTSKIIESWRLRVKRNTFSSLSNQHRVLWWVWRFARFSICLLLMSSIIQDL